MSRLAGLMLVTALLAPLTLACTRPLPTPPASPTIERGAQQDAAITAAAGEYVRAHARITDFAIETPMVSSDYARVRVVPAEVGAPPQWVYLLRQGVNWQGLTMGVTFDAATFDLLGVPADLRLSVATPQSGGR